jgi:AraC-like DNA-binding protein
VAHAQGQGDLRNKEVAVVTSERTINWNLTPAPKLFCANNAVAEGIDFREFGIEGDGSFDYECSVVQIVVNVDSSLKCRSATTEEFREPRPAGASLICLPQERIKGEWRGNGRFLGAYLNPLMVERTFERPFSSINIARGETASPIVEYLLKAIRADVLRGSPGGPAFIQSVIVSLLHHLQLSPVDYAGPAKGGLSRKQLNVLQELIDAQLDGQLSLEQLSREVGVSSGYLSRAFKISMGVSPHQYILQVRVERAKQLIRSSNQALDEIAERVGFADGSHMTTVFLKLTGKSPSQFRNR